MSALSAPEEFPRGASPHGDTIAGSGWRSTLRMFVMPGDIVPIEVSYSVVQGEYRLIAESGAVIRIDDRRWSWIAPASPERCRLLLTDSSMMDVFVIEVQIGVPRADAGVSPSAPSFAAARRAAADPRPPAPGPGASIMAWSLGTTTLADGKIRAGA